MRSPPAGPTRAKRAGDHVRVMDLVSPASCSTRKAAPTMRVPARTSSPVMPRRVVQAEHSQTSPPPSTSCRSRSPRLGRPSASTPSAQPSQADVDGFRGAHHRDLLAADGGGRRGDVGHDRPLRVVGAVGRGEQQARHEGSSASRGRPRRAAPSGRRLGRGGRRVRVSAGVGGGRAGHQQCRRALAPSGSRPRPRRRQRTRSVGRIDAVVSAIGHEVGAPPTGSTSSSATLQRRGGHVGEQAATTGPGSCSVALDASRASRCRGRLRSPARGPMPGSASRPPAPWRRRGRRARRRGRRRPRSGRRRGPPRGPRTGRRAWPAPVSTTSSSRASRAIRGRSSRQVSWMGAPCGARIRSDDPAAAACTCSRTSPRPRAATACSIASSEAPASISAPRSAVRGRAATDVEHQFDHVQPPH